MIPQAAVLTDQGGQYVLLVNDENKVEVRRIETGQRFGANWSLSKGLQAGERIILYGVQKVRPGIEVKPELARGGCPRLWRVQRRAAPRMRPAGTTRDMSGYGRDVGYARGDLGGPRRDRR